MPPIKGALPRREGLLSFYASSAESVDRRLLKLEHCLLWMDKMFFAETIKSSPEKDNADKDFTEQSRAIQVVRLRLRLRHAGWWHGSLGH